MSFILDDSKYRYRDRKIGIHSFDVQPSKLNLISAPFFLKSLLRNIFTNNITC